MQGWRGPAVVLGLMGEGYITLRWQSTCYDVPVNLVRPHVVMNPHAVLNNSGPAPLAIEPPAAAAAPVLADQDSAAVEEQAAHFVFDQREWENYYNVESIDSNTQLHDSAVSLVTIAASLPTNGQQLHVVELRQNVVRSSEQAHQDGHQVF